MKLISLHLIIMAAVIGGTPSGAALVQKKVPYFASIGADRARMRVGPGRNYPASWLYRRSNLPVRVIDHYDHGQWLKVEDPNGTQGWVMAVLISDVRTALVMGSVADLRDSPRGDARTAWRAAPGVVGRLSRCARGWCYLDVRGRGGFVEAVHLWGVEPGESLG